jgi:capsular polysaccharide biosynthesis protein
MKLLFSPPSMDDIIRLFKAWRYWSVGALIGGLIGATIYYIAPPPYRAHAVVLVDFNMEQAWPAETDRQQFYYLEREVRKLEEIAFSDTVMEAIAERNGKVTTTELQNGMLSLSQPSEGGWNFYVDDEDPQRAAMIVALWAQNFTEQVNLRKVMADGPNAFIEASVTQTPRAVVERSVPISTYLFVGAVVFLALGSVVVLFMSSPQPSPTRAERSDSKVEAGSGEMPE